MTIRTASPENCSTPVSPSLLEPRPSDPNLTSQIDPLNETVRNDPMRPDLIRSNAPRWRSKRNGIGQ
jgi:hypothetical protein